MYKSACTQREIVRVNKIVKISTSLVFVVLLTSPSLIHAGRNLFDNYSMFQIPSNSKYLRFKMDPTNDNLRHFIYETGPKVDIEPDGDQRGIVTDPTKINTTIELQNLYYGSVQFTKDQNGTIIADATQVTQELVYKDVFPYQYNFQVDSQGQVHTAFIYNYTLVYGLRDTSGNWHFQNIFNNTYWYSMMPDIALGANELPRITFAAAYKKLGLQYVHSPLYQNTGLGTSHRSVQYVYASDTGNGLNWTIFDVTDSQTYNVFTPERFQALNPGIYINDGIVYIGFNGDYPLSVSSRMEMVRFDEIPTSQTNFTAGRHNWIFETATRATKFRTPNMVVLGGAFLMIVGTSQSGGAMAFMLSHENDAPLPLLAERKTQWKVVYIENERRNIPITAIRAFYDPNTNLYVASYSYYQSLDSSAGTFNNDVFLITIQNLNNEGIGLGYERVTDTNNQQHHYSAPIVDNEGSLEVFYMEQTATKDWNVVLSKRLPLPPTEGGSEWGFMLAVLMMAVITAGSVFGIKHFVPKPKVKEEILPHMVNLRDEISVD